MTVYAIVSLVIVGMALTIALPIVACEWSLRGRSDDESPGEEVFR
jgi:hypothetical protein